MEEINAIFPSYSPQAPKNRSYATAVETSQHICVSNADAVDTSQHSGTESMRN
jgi:hypothetical protein